MSKQRENMVSIVPTKWGKVLARDNDVHIGASLTNYGVYSAGECRLIEAVLRPNDVAVDVGANCGALTVVMAHCVGPKGLVYSFEPQRLAFQMLCGTLAINDYRNTMAVNAPVANVDDLPMNIPDLCPDGHLDWGGLTLTVRHENGIPAKTVTIDSYNMPACRFIKADVEGMEENVLEGARKTIEKYRPVLCVETLKPATAQALEQRWAPLGYRGYMTFYPLYTYPNPKGNKHNRYGDTVSFNWVGLPEWWTDEPPRGCRTMLDFVIQGDGFYVAKGGK